MLQSGITKIAISILEENGSYMLRDFIELYNLQSKNKNSFLKNSDIRLTNRIYESLSTKFPRYRFFHHSDLPIEDGNNYWIYTGIDGNYNFAYANELFGIGLAFYSDKIISSCFYLPLSHRCFWTEHEKPAFLSNYKLSSSRCESSDVKAVVYMDVLNQLVKETNFLDLFIDNFITTSSLNVSICHATLGHCNTIFFNKHNYQAKVSIVIAKNCGFIEVKINDDISCLTLPSLLSKVKSLSTNVLKEQVESAQLKMD